jgi:hypothetical protein
MLLQYLLLLDIVISVLLTPGEFCESHITFVNDCFSEIRQNVLLLCRLQPRVPKKRQSNRTHANVL